MGSKRLFVLCCLVITVCGMDIPSWQALQEKLHEKLEDIYNDRDEVRQTVQVGKYFKYYLPNDQHLTATEEGSNVLPSWLSYDDDKHKLYGIPLQQDVKKGLRIEFKRSDKKDEPSKKLILKFVEGKSNFGCKDSASVASIVFHGNIEQITGSRRVKFLRNLTKQFETGINDFKLEYGNRMDKHELVTSDLKVAGPGDDSSKIVGEQPGFTVSWKIACGSNIEGHPNIGQLRTFTEAEDFSKLHQPVLGWFVISTRSSRNRRALGSTPGVTPAATPTLVVSSASIDVKPSMSTMKIESSSIIISPSKSVPPMVQTSVIPTTKPTTTPQTTTTTTTTSTTEKPTTRKSTTLKPTVNTAPEVVEKYAKTFRRIVVQEQTPVDRQVPVGLFRDDNPLTISLRIKRDTWSEDIPSWIIYREEGRKIYMYPTDQQVGDHSFSLLARDPGGLTAEHTFTVSVNKDQDVYNFKFNMTLGMDYKKMKNDTLEKLKIINGVTKALGYPNLNRIRDLQFRSGSVIMTWSDKMFKNVSSCNNPELRNIKRKLDDTKKLGEEMLPYEVESAGVTSASDECNLVGTIVGADEPEEESLWERILIPVIVIIVILLIILLILCCVYSRKKKYDTQADKDESFMNQKKPVIFLEEYEEKQPDFVSLKPLILPNEKPPAEGYGPRGGSPDGPESSTTASTEDDESAPLAPKSPKETRGGYNAPPPYTAR